MTEIVPVGPRTRSPLVRGIEDGAEHSASGDVSSLDDPSGDSSHFRPSITVVFVIILFVSLSVMGSVVWKIGHDGTQRSISKLSQKLQDNVVERAAYVITSLLESEVKVPEAIVNSIALSVPDFSTQTQISKLVARTLDIFVRADHLKLGWKAVANSRIHIGAIQGPLNVFKQGNTTDIYYFTRSYNASGSFFTMYDNALQPFVVARSSRHIDQAWFNASFEALGQPVMITRRDSLAGGDAYVSDFATSNGNTSFNSVVIGQTGISTTVRATTYLQEIAASLLHRAIICIFDVNNGDPTFIAGTVEGSSALGSELKAELVRHGITNAERTSMYSEASGEEYLVNVLPIPISFVRWSVLLAIPYSEVYGIVNSIQDESLMASIISVVVVLLVTVLISHFSLYSLRQVIESMRMLAATAQISTSHAHVQLTMRRFRKALKLGCFGAREGHYAAASFRRLLLQLEQVEHKLVKSTQARTDFVRYIFHEIRVPLNAVSMSLEMMEPNEFSEVAAEQAKVILRILDDALSLDKMQAANFELECEAICLLDLLENSVKLYMAEIREKRINAQIISGVTREHCSYVMADRIRLQQVAGNIISNAVKFTQPGGHIVVSCKSSTDHDQLYVSVYDDGVAIEEKDRAKLFQPFVQISAGELQKGKGTGLGLSIARQLISLHGGTIGIEPNDPLRPGTTFFFTLPVTRQPLGHCSSHSVQVHHHTAGADDQKKTGHQPLTACVTTGSIDSVMEVASSPAAANEIKVKTESSVGLVSTRLGHGWTPTPRSNTSSSMMRVLLVEDCATNRRLIRLQLKRKGFDVDTAANGKIALDMLLEDMSRYDCILMDGSMPIMDGYVCSQSIREHGVQIPICGLTGNAMTADVQGFLQAGANAVLTKPVDSQKLCDTLSSLIRARPAGTVA